MSKFGEIIDCKVPVLVMLLAKWNKNSCIMEQILLEVVAYYGTRIKAVKIDIDKNLELSEALRIEAIPTFMIYVDGEQKWKESGMKTYKELRIKMNEYA